MKKDEMRKKAKMMMLDHIKKAMKDDDSKDLGEKLGGKLQKVTVMAKDQEGLEKGMSMAQKIMKKRREMEDDEDEYGCGGYKKK